MSERTSGYAVTPRTYRNQFGKEHWLPRPLLETLARWGWRDESWGNDVCPSFGKEGWCIWCDAKSPPLRELSGLRYSVINERAVDVAAFERTADLIAWLNGE